MLEKLVIFVIFTSAQLLKLAWKATQSAGSELTPFATTREYFRLHQVTLALRWFIAALLFWGIWQQPQLVSWALTYVGVNIAVDFHVNGWTAGLYGLTSDTIADVLIVAGNWLRKKVLARFKNGNGDASAAGAGK